MRMMVSIVFVYVFMIASAVAETWFTLADFRTLTARDQASAELVLKAMRETVFFAQESMTGPVVCASPIPISGEKL